MLINSFGVRHIPQHHFANLKRSFAKADLQYLDIPALEE